MGEADEDFGFRAAPHFHSPALVTLTPFTSSISPAQCRLSSNYTKPSRPVPAARKLAWISLEGRLIGAEEATSAKTIGGGLSRHEAVAWELFSPIHRILIVAVVAVSTAESKKNRQIWQLRRSVELRDQVLSSMQKKLDNLCGQVNNVKDQSETETNVSVKKNLDASGDGCWLCDQNRALSNSLVGNSMVKVSRGDEILQYKLPLTNEVEQEERRMSDLSDWGASSVTSAADMQMNTLAIEQDVYNLKRECEEKDATIKELSTFLHTSDVAGSKRIAELEDIIRRKNLIITKLKKDMVVLEQKVIHFTRLQRPSFSVSSSTNKPLPLMTNNLLFDMDSTTSPSSSSDSENRPPSLPPLPPPPPPPVCTTQPQNSNVTIRKALKSAVVKRSSSSTRSTDRLTKSRSVSPLQEKSMNERSESVSSLRPNLQEKSRSQKSESVSSSRSKQLSVSGDFKRSRRRTQSESKDAALHKRWF